MAQTRSPRNRQHTLSEISDEQARQIYSTIGLEVPSEEAIEALELAAKRLIAMSIGQNFMLPGRKERRSAVSNLKTAAEQLNADLRNPVLISVDSPNDNRIADFLKPEWQQELERLEMLCSEILKDIPPTGADANFPRSDFVEDLAEIYSEQTSKEPRLGSDNEGRPAGPFYTFVTETLKAMGLASPQGVSDVISQVLRDRKKLG